MQKEEGRENGRPLIDDIMMGEEQGVRDRINEVLEEKTDMKDV